MALPEGRPDTEVSPEGVTMAGGRHGVLQLEAESTSIWELLTQRKKQVGPMIVPLSETMA